MSCDHYEAPFCGCESNLPPDEDQLSLLDVLEDDA